MCSSFVRHDVTVTQLTNNPRCFVGKRVMTGGFVKENQLGIFIYENLSDREFDREGNSIVMFKGNSNNKHVELFDNADYVQIEILYGGATSISDVYSVNVLKVTNVP